MLWFEDAGGELLLCLTTIYVCVLVLPVGEGLDHVVCSYQYNLVWITIWQIRSTDKDKDVFADEDNDVPRVKTKTINR